VRLNDWCSLSPGPFGSPRLISASAEADISLRGFRVRDTRKEGPSDCTCIRDSTVHVVVVALVLHVNNGRPGRQLQPE